MIPLIIPNFNQLTYLKQLITWWHFYHPEYPVHIVDNGSTYEPLLKFYEKNKDVEWIKIHRAPENKCAENLTEFLKNRFFPFYVISDPDIMPHPATPPNFLEVFKSLIDSGFHHTGFDLITDDIPDWCEKRAHIQYDESQIKSKVDMNGLSFEINRAPLDTTFCLFSSANGGWQAPMNGKDWGNCARVFKAFHLSWYLHPDYINPEMDNYFRTARYRDLTPVSAGKNNYRPEKYK